MQESGRIRGPSAPEWRPRFARRDARRVSAAESPACGARRFRAPFARRWSSGPAIFPSSKRCSISIFRPRRDHLAGERAGPNALSMSDQEFQQFLDAVEEFLKNHGSKELWELTKALLMNRAGELDRMIRDAARRAQLERIERSDEENRFVRALARELGLERMDAELGDLQGQIDQLEDEMLREQLDEYIEARRRALEDLIRRHVRIERARRDGTLRDSEEAGTLADRSFFYLGEDELARMSDAVTMMARRLKSAIAMRRKRSRRRPLRYQTHSADQYEKR